VFLFLAAGAGSAQTVSIVSGQGQLSCAFFCTGFDPLVVVVKDASGAPVPNATVTWTVTGPGSIFGLQTTTTTTDSNGQSSVNFQQQGSSSFGFQFLQSTVTAAVGASSVTFFETTALKDANSAALLVNPQLIQPAVNSTVTGQSGQTLPGAVQVNVGAPNVAVQITDVDGASPARVSCAAGAGQPAGVTLSDASGLATCNLVFGPGIGTSSFNVTIGKTFKVFGPFQAETTAGPPCILTLVSGNNQSGNAGTNLPAPLLAKVTDCGGTPLPGVPVTWGPVTPSNGASLFNTRN
jgi:hypothetical protein